MDRWWNREFPAHSVRRLVFFWVAIPLVNLAVAVVRGLAGAGGGAAGYWITTLGSWVLVTIAWWAAKDQERLPSVEDTLPDAMDAAGIPRWEVPVELDAESDASAVFQQDPTQATPPTGLPGGVGSLPDPWTATQPSRETALRPSLLTDGLVTFLIMWVTMTVVMWRFSSDPSGFGVMDAVMALGAAVLLTATLVLRHSLLVLFLVSSIVGFGGAILLRIFFIFLTDDDGLFWYWLLSTLVIFAFILPVYAPRRRKEPRYSAHRLPGWALALPTGVILVTSVLFLEPSARTEAIRSDAGAPTTPVGTPSFGSQPTPQTASQVVESLIRVSETGAQNEALRLAAPPVVDLFSELVPLGIRLDACREPDPTLGSCSLTTAQGPLLLSVAKASDGRHFISSARLLASPAPTGRSSP